MIKKEPFRSYTLDDEKKKRADVVSLWLNDEEREELDRCKRILEQPKDSTAVKTLARLGAFLIGRPETDYILATVFKNRRNNERSGQPIIE